jgi:hypothetical protein
MEIAKAFNPKTNSVNDREGHFDLDGVSIDPDGIVVSGAKRTPTEEKNSERKKLKIKSKFSTAFTKRDISFLALGFDESISL